MNRLAFRIWSQESKRSESLCFAPAALDQSLVVLLNGSESETFDRLADVLGIDDPDLGDINGARMALVDSLATLPDLPVSLATGLFAVQPAPIRPSFASEMRQSFGSEVRKLGGANRDSARQLSEWVASSSNRRIANFTIQLSKEDPLLSLGITAVSAKFPQTWAIAPPLKFRTGRGTKSVPSVQFEGSVLVGRTTNLMFLKLPLDPPELSLVVVAPGQPGMKLSQVSYQQFTDQIAQLKPEPLRVRFPILELEHEARVDETLRSVGAEGLLKPTNNLRRISHDLDMGTRLGPFHQICRLEITATSGNKRPPSETDIGARLVDIDRPFICFVRHEPTTALLMIARVGDPAVTPPNNGKSSARPQ